MLPAAANLCSTQPSADVQILEYMMKTADSSIQQLEMVVAFRECQPSCTAMHRTTISGSG